VSPGLLLKRAVTAPLPLALTSEANGDVPIFSGAAPVCCGAVQEDQDPELLTRLREGDAAAFAVLVRRYNNSMLRIARGFVSSQAVAEEVVQDTWMGVVRGVDRFEGRAAFKTWLFRILVNRARTTGVREHRSLPVEEVGPAVEAARFDANGNWAIPPEPWEGLEDRQAAAALRPLLRSALDALPVRQREVVTLRDVEGLSSNEVCHVLSITEGNQRVLLHRGRSHMRQALEHQYGKVT
jgi:RNA polymerase sigma-70 factor, ECF subfamily